VPRSLMFVIFSIVMHAAPALAQEAEGATQSTSATWLSVEYWSLYWLPAVLFHFVWLWWSRRWRSTYVKREQKLEAIRELLERNQRRSYPRGT